MRFNEFKKLLEAVAGPDLVIVGDSIAVGVGGVLKNAVTNATVGIGSKQILSNATSDTKIQNANVAVISAGTNDSLQTDQQKTALINNLSAIKRALHAKHVLWISSNVPAADKIIKHVAQSEGDPCVDLSVLSKAPDGIHPGSYPDLAAVIKRKLAGEGWLAQISQAGQKTSNDEKDGKTNKDKTKKDEPFSIVAPTSRKGADVADLQKGLKALGYGLGSTGVDGINGPYTTAAVKKFQKDHGITPSGTPDEKTVTSIMTALKAHPDMMKGLTKSTDADVHSGNFSLNAPELAAFNTEENMAEAKQVADKFLGREMSDKEWNYLLRATYAEATSNQKESAYVMAVILNRARSGKYGDVVGTLRWPNAFQAVTGTSKNGHQPSSNFQQGPQGGSMGNLLKAVIEQLPSAPKNIMRFTAVDPAAYGPGTNIGYLAQLKKDGGTIIGGTIFA
jgi:peptidoglycan hydrolase-like protein with peptidoglycan-binding domain